MKITNKKMLENAGFLSIIAKKQLPVKVSYAIAKNISKIEKELKIYEEERLKLLEKYAVKDEDGKVVIEKNKIKIDENKRDSWEKEINELLEIEVDINMHKFKLEYLDNLNMSAEELVLLDYMIEE